MARRRQGSVAAVCEPEEIDRGGRGAALRRSLAEEDERPSRPRRPPRSVRVARSDEDDGGEQSSRLTMRRNL
jgi:hypothetical protein